MLFPSPHFLCLYHDYVIEKSKALEEELEELEAEKARIR